MPSEMVLSEAERQRLDLMIARGLLATHHAFPVPRPQGDGRFVYVCRGCEGRPESPCDVERWALDVLARYGASDPGEPVKEPTAEPEGR